MDLRRVNWHRNSNDLGFCKMEVTNGVLTEHNRKLGLLYDTTEDNRRLGFDS
jgi:hypothetical protein